MSRDPGVSRDQPSSSSVVSREQARSRPEEFGRTLSYDEMFEDEDADTILDNDEFRFEDLEDMENIELI